MIRLMSSALLLAILLGSGCAVAPPPSLYLLTADTTGAPVNSIGPVAPVGSFAVALVPVTVPDYLDRIDIVRRASDNRLAFDENRRWAEPLRAGLQRVLSAELARRLGAGAWIGNGGGRGTSVDVEVAVDVDAFELNAAGQVVLSASWEIRRVGDDRKPVRQRVRYQRALPADPAGLTDTERQVGVMSAEIGDLAADLSKALAPSAGRAR